MPLIIAYVMLGSEIRFGHFKKLNISNFVAVTIYKKTF